MNLSQKIRTLQIINHGLFLAGLIYIIVTNQYQFLIGIVIVMYLMQVLGINIGFHRYLTHRSFKTNLIIDKILVFFGVITLVGTPLSWCISHVNHHAYPDKEGDPYSPHRIKVWDYLMSRFEPVKHSRIGLKTLMANKTVMFFHTHYFKVIFAYCLILFSINPWFVILFWSMPSLLAMYLILVTNILCHVTGYRNYETDDKSTNNVLVSVLTLGEGWHNNHHKFPQEYYNRKKYWEIDITGMIIKLIKK